MDIIIEPNSKLSVIINLTFLLLLSLPLNKDKIMSPMLSNVKGLLQIVSSCTNVSLKEGAMDAMDAMDSSIGSFGLYMVTVAVLELIRKSLQ